MAPWRFYGSAPPPSPVLGDDDIERAKETGASSVSSSWWVLIALLKGVAVALVLSIWFLAHAGRGSISDVLPERVARKLPDLGKCEPACDYLGKEAPRSLIIYNTTWRAGLHDRQDFFHTVLTQLASLTCAKVAIASPADTLDISHNNGMLMPREWRWDTYFDNRSRVPYGYSGRDEKQDGFPIPILMDWFADAEAIRTTYLNEANNPGVRVFGDAVADLTDEKIVADLRAALECAENGTPFVWRMNFEPTWGERYEYWERDVKNSPEEEKMYAVELSTLERALWVDGRLHRSVRLWDCELAEVTTSAVVRKLADIATTLIVDAGQTGDDPKEARALLGGGGGVSVVGGVGGNARLGGDDLISSVFLGDESSASTSSPSTKFAVVHARRGDELEWCATDPESLRDFVTCALANSTDADARSGNVPVVFFTDDPDEEYAERAVEAMEESLRRYAGSSARSGGIVYGETIVNTTVERYLRAAADELKVNVGWGPDRNDALSMNVAVPRVRDNYLRYQIAEELMARSDARADALWNIHLSRAEPFGESTCGPPRGHVCAQPGLVLRMARGDEEVLGDARNEFLLDIGTNAFLVGGEKLRSERQAIASSRDGNTETSS
jgi:hypothetical protein